MTTVVLLTEQRTFEGFTYQPGEHEVADSTAAGMLANWPAVCSLKKTTVPKKGKRSQVKKALDAVTAATEAEDLRS